MRVAYILQARVWCAIRAPCDRPRGGERSHRLLITQVAAILSAAAHSGVLKSHNGHTKKVPAFVNLGRSHRCKSCDRPFAAIGRAGEGGCRQVRGWLHFPWRCKMCVTVALIFHCPCVHRAFIPHAEFIYGLHICATAEGCQKSIV